MSNIKYIAKVYVLKYKLIYDIFVYLHEWKIININYLNL